MSTKKVISSKEWDRQLKAVHVNKEDLNKLVMNYLVVEGYKDVAETFRRESGTDPEVDLNAMEERMKIRNSIQQGNIQEGIERVNDLNPEILDSDPRLVFHLKQQQLIELIRRGDTEGALLFAQEEMARRGEENPEFLEELEKTMALMAFEDQDSCPVAGLLDSSQRQRTAGELNSAILASQCQEKDPKLPVLLKLLVWAQAQLEQKAIFPAMDVNGEYKPSKES